MTAYRAAVTTASDASAAPRGRSPPRRQPGPVGHRRHRRVGRDRCGSAGRSGRASPPRAGFDLALLLDGARRVARRPEPVRPGDARRRLARRASSCSTRTRRRSPRRCAASRGCRTASCSCCGASARPSGSGSSGARLAAPSRASRRPLPMAVRAIAIAPLVLPFAVAVLFGNLDAWYPLAYGALLLAALPGERPPDAGRGRASPSPSSRSPSSTRRRSPVGRAARVARARRSARPGARRGRRGRARDRRGEPARRRRPAAGSTTSRS